MAAVHEYQCPCCGGGIVFDSAVQKMKCPYCDTEFELETLDNYQNELQAETPDDLSWDTDAGSAWTASDNAGLKRYSCKSCGAEIMADESRGAMKCPYCDSPIVMTGQFAGDLKPDLVIPFKLDKKAAKEALKKHCSGKKLLPKVFLEDNHIDELQGIYVPFWVFDAEADANFRYRATRVRHWSDNRFEYTETSHYAVSRAGTLDFTNVPVDASNKIATELMQSIEPFNMEEAVDFRTAYLAGYLADKYDVSAEESVEVANQRVCASTEAAFAATVQGFTSVTKEYSGIQLHNGRAKYVLCPVWLLNTSWDGKKYVFAMNGQTGRMVGDLPMDKGLLNKYFMKYGGIAAAVVFVLTTVLGLF